ncbi:MAG: AAA family ATPase [Alphaproteobacteria bacterium]|nr:AAA family ATPase [Alphaproteobacteria bacterium]
MQFSALRLSGFKSFVDPTELTIEPGLSGVVGPNGCGKSNLVEALRWVMGETSAKKMRGGGMDDIIFGGTTERPSRNIAEVMLVLDNGDRTAPSSFNDSDILEISRRIERESGSVYRVNGKDVRARDVQLLFADLATGARSGAMVSQGRVGALINAKPADRRILLEEAAGISGLHSRRHEAELRLRAAEGNLERLDDVLAALDGQLKALKRQARQAARYRNIGEHIRKAEAIVLYLRWQTASQELATTQASLNAVTAKVGELAGQATRQTTEHAEAADKLPALRQSEAEAAAALHRLTAAREAIDAERERLRLAKADADARLEQIAQDITRELALSADAEAAEKRLSEERDALTAGQDNQEAETRAAEEAVAAAESEVDGLDGEMSALTQSILTEEARRTAAQRRIAEIEERIARLRERGERVNEERAASASHTETADQIAAAEDAVATAAAALGDRQSEAESVETARTEAQDGEMTARETAQQAEETLAGLRAEERALAELLAEGRPESWAPIIDSVAVDAGYEDALGAALGDDLTASDDSAAPIHWRDLPPITGAPPLPDGAEPLSKFVRGPRTLERRLAQIGVVPDRATGLRLGGDLAIGQRLVSRAGELWRWDGFTVTAGADTAAATRLGQRNRLAEVRSDLTAANDTAATAREHFETARAAAADAAASEATARQSLRQAFAALAAARDSQARLVRENAESASRLAALDQAGEQVAADLNEAEAELAAARDAVADGLDLEEKRRQQQGLRERLGAARLDLIERRSRHDRLLSEAEARGARLDAIGDDLRSWQQRTENARQQMRTLAERRDATRTEISQLEAAPAEIDEKRRALLAEIDRSEITRKEAADALVAAENVLNAIAKALREAEAALADAREERARSEGAVAQIEQSRDAIRDRMKERLDCAPDQALAVAGHEPGDQLPEPGTVETRLERLLRERDNIGPVNLRAEQEVKELGEQIASLDQERGDLIDAIARLRQGINELNREGRARLLESFKEVNTHFEELFVRLFGGGHAYIRLIESDDPLDAGLEIFASPPGKKLQILSLLSGGEQALTALALLFSVFLTNPAPICVLDEVDAPLDDANVDRFCKLLADIAESSATRFLIVTHHRMTMARMDRLYGVTMPEQGISQLVSVDLQTAEELRDSA